MNQKLQRTLVGELRKDFNRIGQDFARRKRAEIEAGLIKDENISAVESAIDFAIKAADAALMELVVPEQRLIYESDPRKDLTPDGRYLERD